DFRNSSGAYQIRAVIINDSAIATNGAWHTITDSSHFMEVDWSAATVAGANNGYLTLWLDGNIAQTLSGIDNDTHHADRVLLGPTGGLDSTTIGTYYFDAFESRRQCYIGPVDGPPIPPTVTSVVRADTNPTRGASVNYTVTFSECVTGVDVSDFVLDAQGVSGAAVSAVSGSGLSYTVTVNTGTGNGSIRLDVLDNDSILDLQSLPLNGGFTGGEIYTVIKNAEVSVNIAGNNAGNYVIPIQGSERIAFPGVDNGPAQVISTNDLDILAALRVIWKEPGFRASYSEMMGLPKEQLSTEYWFPWYNNVDTASMDQGFRIANMDTSPHIVKVFVGTTQIGNNINLAAGGSTRVGYAVNNGPIRIVCSDCTGSGKIIAALRVIWREPGPRFSYSEMMGLPVEQLSNEYWFPWYNNATASMDQGFRIANVSTTESNTVEVWVGNSKLDAISLPPGGSTRVGYTVDNGPARIVCITCTNTGSDKIIAALRVIWKEPGFRASYSEMMGLPKEQLSTEYWFPWYNNTDTISMDQGFRIANVDTSPHIVKVFVGATQIGTDISLAAGGSTRVGYAVNNGPIRIVCTTCNPANSDDRIITALRVIWQEPGYRSSYSEMMGLPLEALSTEYWFPWYNNATASMDQGFRIAVP
ncbi:MAG TPA: hypothetical protein VJM08_03990, partial [Anaerolineales bacterium]|nr:hypothetical protein [Anaerolineales bacterium]